MKSDIFTVIDDIDIFVTNSGGRQIEVSRLILDIEINESMFDGFVTGKMLLADTLDILKNFAIVGNETIDISIHTTDADSSTTLEFALYKIERDKTNYKGDVKRKMLELYFCSREAVANGRTSVSKRFSASPEAVVQTVLTDHLSSSKDLSADPTTGDVTVHSNFWKPTKIIDFVSRHATTGTYSDFVFFETLSGFSFRAVSGLLAQSPVHDLSFDTDTESFIGNANIKVYKFDRYFDVVRSLREGLFGSTFYKPHDTSYAYSKSESTLAQNWENITTNGSSRMFDDALGSSLNMVDTNFYEPDVSKVRLASLKLLRNYNLVVKVNGDFGRKPGDNLNVSFPNLDNESTIHEYFQGNWIILGIKHSISQRNQYTQNIFLGKNAFFNHRDLPGISAMVNA